MRTPSYIARRGELTTYFDKTAAAAWKALTSTDPVGRVRATVRAGRDHMRANLLGWLPDDLSGQTVLDAGCGTGALAVEAARRGAYVVAIDVASSLIDVARKRADDVALAGEIEFRGRRHAERCAGAGRPHRRDGFADSLRRERRTRSYRRVLRAAHIHRCRSRWRRGPRHSRRCMSSDA